MRLLNISTLEFQDFPTLERRPPYAIASHRWGVEEATFKDVQQRRNVVNLGYSKIQGFCRLVNRMNEQADASKKALSDLDLRHRCDWLWIDTACINKEDMAELSESINSMFRWYADASVCYVYLADVKPTHKFWSLTLDMMRSQWFKRGWTLQELIAPRTVVFVAKNWEVLGHKCGYGEKACATVCLGFGTRLNKMLAQITGIPTNVLAFGRLEQLRHISAAQKMSWAERRVTTRPEDRAYCLLGLLDVFINPIYGEGDNAWARLQQALEFKRSLESPTPLSNMPNKPQSWFQRKEVVKRVVRTGRLASSSTTTTELKGYHSTSEPVERTTVSHSAMGASWSADYAAGHNVSAPAGPSNTSYTYGMTTRYTPVSAPSLRPDRYAVISPRLVHDPDLAGPELIREDSEQPSAGQADSFRIGPIGEEPSPLRPDSTLRHRFGSAWSLHSNGAFDSVWYHELPAEEASRGLQQHIKVIMGTKVRALFDFIPSQPDELKFKRGDIITTLRSVYRDWNQGYLKGQIGVYPLNYVEQLVNPVQADFGVLADGEVNVSTLAAGKAPGLRDWVKHDARTPGGWPYLQSHLVSMSADESTGDNLHGQATTEHPKTKSRESVREAAEHSTAQSGGYVETWQQEEYSSTDSTPDSPVGVEEIQPGYAFTNQQMATVFPDPSTDNVSTHVKYQMSTTMILSQNGTPEDDESSVQGEDHGTNHWRPSNRLPSPRGLTDINSDLGSQPEADRYPLVTQGQKSDVLVNTTSVNEVEDTPNITIPKIVLRALLNPQIATDMTDPAETALLAGTAIEYIRSLLLSDLKVSTTAGPPMSGPVQVITSAYQQTSIIQNLPAPTEDASGRALRKHPDTPYVSASEWIVEEQAEGAG